MIWQIENHLPLGGGQACQRQPQIIVGVCGWVVQISIVFCDLNIIPRIDFTGHHLLKYIIPFY
jgi:hypothetical protein